MIETIGVLGGGAWGTALALTAARAGREVRLWARDADTVAAIDERRENPRYLPGVALGARAGDHAASRSRSAPTRSCSRSRPRRSAR